MMSCIKGVDILYSECQPEKLRQYLLWDQRLWGDDVLPTNDRQRGVMRDLKFLEEQGSTGRNNVTIRRLWPKVERIEGVGDVQRS